MMVRRVWVAAAALTATAGVAAAVVAATTDGGARGTLRRVALPPGDRAVALSFDDGPDRVWTPLVLAELARAHAAATFFDVGVRAAARPDLVRQELALGEVQDHTETHRDLLRLSRAEAIAEITAGATSIGRSGAPRPTLFRPPLGHITTALVDAARRAGLRTVLWSVAVERYTDHVGTAAAVRDVLARVRPGSIVLAHDGGPPGRARTVAALPLLLEGLHRLGYRVLTVSQLLALARGREHRAAG